MAKSFLFTSESVSAGHPDKLADAVSDAIVDSIFKIGGETSRNRAAVETLVTENTTILAGEVKIPDNAEIDYVGIARNTIRRIGYTDPELKFDDKLSTVGFSFGFGLKVKRFRIDYANSRFHLAGSSNLFSVAINLNESF